MPLLGLTIRRALLSYNYWLRSGKRESWGVRAVGPWHNPALAISPLNNQFTPMVCVSPHCYTNRHTLCRTTYTCNTATYTVIPISTVLTSCCTVDTLYSNTPPCWLQCLHVCSLDNPVVILSLYYSNSTVFSSTTLGTYCIPHAPILVKNWYARFVFQQLPSVILLSRCP